MRRADTVDDHLGMSRDATPGLRINADTEISSMHEDRLDRAPYARRIAERIEEAGKGPSVVFGLAGPWGSGKTSVIRMITEVLSEEHGKKWEVVSFTPWSAADTAALLDEFYQAIAAAMPKSKKGNRARKLLAAAAPAASAAGKTGAIALVEKYLGKGAVKDLAEAMTEAIAEQAGEYTFDAEPDPFAEQFTKISEAIAKAGKNVLVIVDDVDRLHSDELLAVMKAVRLLGRFDRVHYLLSYDHQTVLDVLEQTDLARGNRRRARDYLEKMVQYPFVLPPLQQVHLAEELRTHLKEVARIHGVPVGPPEGRGMDAAEVVFEVYPHRERLTLRGIYRLCNQVDVMLALIGSGEIDLVDATLLTALRLHHPDLHDRLPRWRRELLNRSGYNMIGHGKTITAEQWRQRIADAAGQQVSDDDVTEIYRILVALFPEMTRPPGMYAPSHSRSCRIHASDYFDRYFAFRIPVRDVRDETVRIELNELVQRGTWPNDSLIHECLGDDPRRRLARTKILHNLDLIAQGPAAGCAAAAVLISRELSSDRHALVFSGWGDVVYALLVRAICAADTPDAAVQTVKDYRNDCGLSATIDVLAHRSDLDFADPEKIRDATAMIRDEVLELARRDLTTDLPPEERSEFSILGTVHFFDDQMWTQLRDSLVPHLENGSITHGELAARFVTISPADRHHEFCQKDFAFLIPQESWELDQFPLDDDADVDVADPSLANRMVYAAKAIRKVLASQPDGEEQN